MAKLFTSQCINPPPWSGEGIIGMHFVRPSVCPSVRPSVTLRVSAITYVCIHGLPSNLVQTFIETMCNDHDPNTYLKDQGHTRLLKVRVHMLVAAL